ncbi:hypothetical protein BX661DRAFT_216646 [Kickxella alabastrina]|uniref:uncharacterized protein n=1 Tax=Kickxella alabastrina TaxID=61397 RepID=UPI00221F177C|nr:uncharacterized protein BX661DRAFT_216646 [Kickxella alabastrina]KAI7822298.1 hypothetical protein BX661DRAFT_216646 [Kickxella alabastrina]KAJ1946641.1 hypothetical protein GGF37_001033 [Kickxella alabastrina]
MKTQLSFSALVVTVLTSAQAGLISTITIPTLHIFGDSLSDVGTLKDLTLNLIPPKPYWEGRFSSGPVWNEYLAKLLGYNLYNKAVGGGTSDNANSALLNILPIPLPISIPSSQDQIDTFKFKNPKYKLSYSVKKDIAVLEIGANDFFAEMINMSTNKLPVGSFVETLSNSVVSQLEQIRSIGFKNIIVTNLAAIQFTPFADILHLESLANTTVHRYNDQLTRKVNAWASKALGLTSFSIADIGGFVETTVNSEAIANSLGLTSVSTSCVGGNALNLLQADNKLLALMKLIFDAKENLMCADPSKSYFFDFVHPGEKITRLFGYYTKELIDAVNSGKQMSMTEDNLLNIINKYSLGSPVAKPVQI